MRQKVYAAPSASRKLGYPNPYVPNLKRELAGSFDVLEADIYTTCGKGKGPLVFVR